MSYQSHDFEGFTPGQTISTANSNVGGKPALTVATGATRVADNSVAMHGSQSANLSATSGATTILGWNNSNNAAAVFRGYVRLPSVSPVAACDIIQVRRAAGNGGSVQLRTDGKLNIINRAGTGVHVTPALSVNTWYRIEIRFVHGTGSGDGTIQFAIYAGDSLTAIDSYSTTTTDCGTDNFVGFYFGKLTAIAATFGGNFDDVAYDEGGTDLLGPMIGDSAMACTLTRVLRADFTDSVGTVDLTQLSGTAITINQISSTLFEILEPDHPDPIIIQRSVDGDGPPVVDTFTLPPTNLATRRRLRKGGVGSNWNDWE